MSKKKIEVTEAELKVRKLRRISLACFIIAAVLFLTFSIFAFGQFHEMNIANGANDSSISGNFDRMVTSGLGALWLLFAAGVVFLIEAIYFLIMRISLIDSWFGTKFFALILSILFSMLYMCIYSAITSISSKAGIIGLCSIAGIVLLFIINKVLWGKFNK